ncbi:acyltransferase family protein [Gordonia sputi]
MVDVRLTDILAPAAPAAPKRQFFDDIAGLRGIAVLVVVAFHSRIPFIPGGFVGVDIFFVISGFLITRQLVNEFEQTKTVSFKGFYARRCRRIIPAASLVIVVSLVAAIITMPLLKVFKQSLDLLAAAANVANWHFIAQNADYLSGAIDGSLATHFWSLSIEEQIYLGWPLVIFAAAVVVTRTALRRRVSARISIGVVVGVITVVSLVWCIQTTAVDPAYAYMATQTRIWQFGVGALIAVAAPWLTRAPAAGRACRDHPAAGRAAPAAGRAAPAAGRAAPAAGRACRDHLAVRIVAVVLGWAGLAGIAAACVLIDSRTPYPGTAALLPTLSAALVIVSGQLAGTGLPLVGSLLSLAPLRFLGRVSYSWYLWHWPVLVIFEAQTGIRSWQILVAVSVGSLAIATLSTLYFEEPIIANAELRRNASASISVGVTGLVVALSVAMTSGVLVVKAASRDTVAHASLSYDAVFGQARSAMSGPVTPNPFQAYDDRPSPTECLVPVGQQAPTRSCVFGRAGGIPVVLFGDSHAEQWSEAIRSIGDAHGWQIHQFTKAACPAQDLTPRPRQQDPFNKQDCLDWRTSSVAAIDQLRPKIIVVSSLSTYVPDYASSQEAWNRTLARLRATGARLVYIEDTPYPGFQIADCMSGALDNWHRCDFGLDGFTRIEPILDAQARGQDSDITSIGVNDLLCEANTCFPARNKIMFYRDDSHLTNTAATVLEPALVSRLDAQRFDYTAR